MRSVAEMEESYWMFATGGGAGLVAGEKKKATNFYEQAMRKQGNVAAVLTPIVPSSLGSWVKICWAGFGDHEMSCLLANLDRGPLRIVEGNDGVVIFSNSAFCLVNGFLSHEHRDGLQ